LDTADLSRGLVIDLGAVKDIDTTGIEALCALVEQGHGKGATVAILGTRPSVRTALLASPDRPTFEPRLASTTSEVEQMISEPTQKHGRGRLVRGVSLFRSEHRSDLESIFREIGSSQKPHTLFITCADSRISPSLITGTDPGEVFILRNIGALVPYEGASGMINELAGVRFAVDVLEVRTIVVCGHSNCGAAKLLFGPGEIGAKEPFASFRKQALPVAGDVDHAYDADDAAKRIVKQQLDNLASHDFIRVRVERGELSLHGWYYDVGAPELYEWCTEARAFVPVRDHAA
ncbi:MAG: STAS domain-containing protein, partial [Polyangiaceae bacterium]|nr:STAS domain-containing protein [Polyangiaceae bacterium]